MFVPRLQVIPVEGSEPRHVLTPEQRSRLRPTVDVETLERLLGRLSPEWHPFVLLLCDRAPTQEQWTTVFPDAAHGVRVISDVHLRDPALEALWQAVEPGRAT